MAESSTNPGALRLRALAHPLRWKLFDIVFREGTATATRCAELTGESVASCYYHLNILGKYGYVEHVPGSGKEKPWRSVSTRQDLSAPGPELEDQLASEAATEAFLEHEFDRLRAWGAPARDRACGNGGTRPAWAAPTMWVTAEETATDPRRDHCRPAGATPSDRRIRHCVLPVARAARVFFYHRRQFAVLNAPARRRGGLWRQRDFGLFWTGESISEVGNSVTIVVVPLIAIDTLHASTFIVTVLTAMVWLPWLLVGVPAGVWIDRLPPRPVMLAT